MRLMPWVFLITIYMLKAQPAAGTSFESSAPSGSMAVLRNADGEEESQARECTGWKQENPEVVLAHLYSPKTVGTSKNTPESQYGTENLIIHQLPVRGLSKRFLCNNMQMFPQLCNPAPQKGESITAIWLPIMIMTVLLFIIKYYLALKPRYRTWTLSPPKGPVASCPGLQPPPKQNFAATFWLWKDVLWVMQMIWKLNSWFLQRDF